ncbi:ADP-ribosylation factor-like protein [Geomonas sp. RF6]|uniref:GTP-binding protein n=1 Tax=Geomonas sp. RF6 TaxID=2897342 RepID=UPI001E50F5B5|nr:ADP-ribosylation factor-like protein [Geomonas sp. RF6]UFS69834.1 ADP-ribosylation factor-like protein [Geomonas sp. RF6]
MALVNQAKREINAKVVYFGPGLSGKGTSLRHIFGKLKPEFRGAMKGMQVKDARMLFFDFTPPGDSNVHGFRVRFHLYTISGETIDAAAWKMVLKGADGIVFVADSSIDRVSANRESLEKLNAHLGGYGTSLESVPTVFQYNKKDLPDALPAADLNRMLNASGMPSFEASSQEGEGVIQPLLALVKSVLLDLRRKGLEGIVGPESMKEVVETPVEEPVAPVEEPQAPAAQEEPHMPHYEEHPVAAPDIPLYPEVKAPEVKAPESHVAAEEEGGLSLELSGAAELSQGLLRLPLVIRSGSRSKTVTLQLSIQEE